MYYYIVTRVVPYIDRVLNYYHCIQLFNPGLWSSPATFHKRFEDLFALGPLSLYIPNILLQVKLFFTNGMNLISLEDSEVKI